MVRLIATAAAAAALLAGAASAQDAAPAGDVTVVEEVTVRAAPKEVIADFVASVSAPTKERKLARWNKTICPATLGLERRYAEYLNDRLAAVALDAGVKIAKPGCRPDLLIIVTADPQALLTQMAADHGDFFAVKRWSYERTSAGSAEDLRAFVSADRPVRWWHVSESVPADGRPLGGGGAALRVTSPSRLRDTMREDFQHALLVVDARHARGVTYQALADYVAMAALAQLNEEADTAHVPTILNLFKADASRRPAGLTDWDRAYLRGLYGARADAPDLRSQRGRILSSMRRR